MDDVVDWDLAVSTGRRLVPAGPEMSGSDAYAVVAELRALAREAVTPVRELTGLIAVEGTAQVAVVDRTAWLDSNVAGFRVVLAPALDQLRDKQATSPWVTSVGARVTALQMGGVLAYLSGKVLGQFEAFSPNGRLLLVAPNIVAAERALAVPPRDFRLWVCLHEETHRVQFGAVPWLGDHLIAAIHTYLSLADVSAGEAMRRFRAVLSALVSAVRGADGPSIVEVAQTPAQREIFDGITATMSLLEGHADFVMDEVGPQIVPSVALIRERFDGRRHNPGAMDGLARRVLGLDAKMRQYSEGAAFVRGVVDRVGPSGFARVWEQPANLPTLLEIADPGAWATRVAADLLP